MAIWADGLKSGIFEALYLGLKLFDLLHKMKSRASLHVSPPQGKTAKDDGDDGDTEFFGGEEIIASLSLSLSLVVARSHHVGPRGSSRIAKTERPPHNHQN